MDFTALATDADPGTIISYSLTDDAGGRFAINATTGVVTVANGSLLDYETATSHNITVLATSTDGSSNSQTFNILVTNAGDNPVVGPADTNAAANTGMTHPAQSGSGAATPAHKPSAPKTKARSLLPIGPS